MRRSIVIFGCVFLSSVTAVPLKPSHCGVDLRPTPSDNVLAGTNTPVFFFRSHKYSPVGHFLIRQESAIANLTKESTFFNKSVDGRTHINKQCSASETWGWELNFPMKCTALDTIYPRIVVVVDYGIFRRYERKSNGLTKLLEHVLAYWNGVDLNFRTLEKPKMRLNIAGIIIEEHADGLPFLSQRMVDGRLKYEATVASLYQFMTTNGSYWSDYFGRYHIVVVMTSKKLYSNRQNGELTAGGSYDPMCQETMNGPGQRLLIGDDGGWLRIRAISDFLAQSFKSSVPGRDGSSCSKDESAVMNYYSSVTKDLPNWSDCFLDSFKMRFNNSEAKCLYEKPKIISPLPRVLPGQILNADGQCAISRGTGCCKSESICRYLMCELTKMSGACVSIGVYAADGTTCGDEKICFRRKCVFAKDIE